ncbi:Listeria/Bacterioides repeat-containing protein [Ruminococcaceae bacterium YRB3002]|nr:Listeria/Bacterioides repeat-containing protein [Ruminococcaceae bacterium YRB3002]
MPDLNPLVEPSIDGDGRYILGTIAYYTLVVGDTTYYFYQTDGHPGDQFDGTGTELSYFDFDGRTVVRYTGPVEETGVTVINIPASYGDEDSPVTLTTLGVSGTDFIDSSANDDDIQILDWGNITLLEAASFSGIEDLVFVLNTAEHLVVSPAFNNCGDVAVTCNHSAGLPYGPNTEGGYTVTFIDDHVFNRITNEEWADDYSSAGFSVGCECGISVPVMNTVITRQSTGNNTLTITATGTVRIGEEEVEFSNVLENVPAYKVTMEGVNGFVLVPCKYNVNTRTFSNGASFTFEGIGASAATYDYSTATGWTDGIHSYTNTETVTIYADTHYYPTYSTSWSGVNEALAAAAEPEAEHEITITLHGNMTPSPGDRYLYVPAGVSATIDLNGFTINRDLILATVDGYVIKVDGTLTLLNGTVTGGKNTGNGGGIYVGSGGYLHLFYTEITLNSAVNGGGIFLEEDGGNAVMFRGAITENYASYYGGGVYVAPGADFTMTTEVTDLMTDVPISSLDGDMAIIENNVAGINGGGVYIRIDGTSYFNGRSQVVNNTLGTSGGEFNNIAPEIPDSATSADVIAKILEGMIIIGLAIGGAALLGLAIKGAAAVTAGAIVVALIAAAVIGTAYIIYLILDSGSKRDSSTPGGQDTDQRDRGTCNHPNRSASWNWKADYSQADCAMVCTVCGNIAHSNCVPVSVVDTSTKVTTYTATVQDPEQRTYTDSRVVQPYTLTIRNDDASYTGIKEQEILVPHGKDINGGNATVQYTLEIPDEWKHLITDYKYPNKWVCEQDSSKEYQVTHEYLEPVEIDVDDQHNIYTLKWYIAHEVKYEAGADDVTGSMAPHERVFIEHEKSYTLKDCGWSREGYVFDGWEVSIKGVKEKHDPGYKIEKVVDDVTITATWKSKWSIFQEKMTDGAALTLTDYLVATADDIQLHSDGGTVVTIDLGGLAIDRNCSSEKIDSGYSIEVKGDLSLTHGTITGGSVPGGCGGIVVINGGILRISGYLNIKNNTDGNVYLADDSSLVISDTLDEETRIGITMETPGVFTSGLSGKGSVENFISDDPRYVVGLTDEGEACLMAKISYDIGDPDASGTVPEDELVAIGSTYTLPVCTFTAPEGKQFKHWEISEGNTAPFTKNEYESFTVTQNTTIKAVWDDADEPDFGFHSVLLSGQLGVVYYMELPGSISTYDDSYMVFTVNGEDQTFRMSDVTKTYTDKTTGIKYYAFICYISSVQMAEDITSVFHYGDDKTISKIYSLDRYKQYVLAHKSDYKEEEVALVEAIADFGHYVQPVLAAQNHWDYGVKYKTMDFVNGIGSPDFDKVLDSVVPYAINTDTHMSGNNIYFALNLQSETTIGVFLETNADAETEVTATVDGNAAAVTRSGNYYRVKIEGIPAHRLGENHTVVFYVDGDKVTTTTVNALSYVHTILSAPGNTFDNDYKLRQMVTAIYYYYEATVNYRALH